MFPEGLGMSRPETKGSAGLRAGCKHHNFRTGTKSTVGGRKVLLMLLLKSPKAKQAHYTSKTASKSLQMLLASADGGGRTEVATAA